MVHYDYARTFDEWCRNADAARTIQRVFRQWQDRRSDAASTIQTAFRGRTLRVPPPHGAATAQQCCLQ